MKRISSLMIPLVLGYLFVTATTVFAQGGTEGFPPQTALFNDAVLFARVLPFFIALGVGFGVWRAKASVRAPVYTTGSATAIRHDLGIVITHWVNASGFITGSITGLIVLRWLPRPDDMRIIFIIHYIGAAIVVFAVATHLAQQGVTGGRGLLVRSFKEVTEGLGEMVEYAGFYGPEGAVFHLNIPQGIRQPIAEIFAAFGFKPPKQLDKYLPPEKAFSYLPWAIIIGGIVITGLIKSFRYLYPIPPSFINLTSIVHDFLALASVFMLAIHLAAVLLVPKNWPLLKSMFTTRISIEYVKKYHHVWYDKLMKLSGQAAASPAAAPRSPASAGK